MAITAINAIIIEDEQPAYNVLSKLIKEVQPNINIVAWLDSIQETVDWLKNNAQPNVVFLDVHLADGSAFDLLKQVRFTCPIIFTTAYDQYAIDAFKESSVDYLLKPVTKEDLEGAFQKLAELREMFSDNALAEPKTYKKRFLVRYGEHIKTLITEDIAYCYSENRATFAKTFDGRNLPLDHNLDALDEMLDPQHFFRINRQYIVNLKAIEDMRTYSKARVLVQLKPPTKETQIVSSEKSAMFKQWLAGEL